MKNRFRQAGFAGVEHVAAAMHVDQFAVAVFGSDGLRRHDEDPHAVDRGLLDLDLQPLQHPRHILDQRRCASIRDRFPLLTGLGTDVPIRPQRCADDLLELRADVARRSKRLGGNLQGARRRHLRFGCRGKAKQRKAAEGQDG